VPLLEVEVWARRIKSPYHTGGRGSPYRCPYLTCWANTYTRVNLAIPYVNKWLLGGQ
jgi:hypothetical protein